MNPNGQFRDFSISFFSAETFFFGFVLLRKLEKIDVKTTTFRWSSYPKTSGKNRGLLMMPTKDPDTLAVAGALFNMGH